LNWKKDFAFLEIVFIEKLFI